MISFKIVLISITLFTFLLTISPEMGLTVEWVEVPSTTENHQWWDLNSVTKTKDNKIEVITLFRQADIDKEQSINTTQYLMEIDCIKKLFRDSSINGSPQLDATWKSPNNDELVGGVINNVCSHKIK